MSESNEFSETELSAVIKVLKEVMFADKVVHYTEILYLGELRGTLNIDSDFVNRSIKLTSDEAIQILSFMTKGKKDRIVSMMNDMAMADGKFTKEEKELLTDVFTKAGLELRLPNA